MTENTHYVYAHISPITKCVFYIGGGTPWNKGLLNSQACATKKVIYNEITFDSVQNLISYLKIGTTTFYRRIKKGSLKIKHV